MNKTVGNKIISLFLVLIFVATSNVYSLEYEDTLRKPMQDGTLNRIKAMLREMDGESPALIDDSIAEHKGESIKAKIQRTQLARLLIQNKTAQDNNLWIFVYRRLSELEKLLRKIYQYESAQLMAQLKQEAYKKAKVQADPLGLLALDTGLLISYDGISPDLPDKFLGMMQKDGLMNVTTNGALIAALLDVFKADIAILARQGLSVEDIYNALVAKGLVKLAAKKLAPVVESGEQGGVSIEVRSHLKDADAMFKEAMFLAKQADVSGMVMNKLPATKAGIIAVRKAIAAGLYPNVTLLFCSREQIKAVARAIAEGLQERVANLRQAGKDEEEVIDEVMKFKSFISYFVSRVTGSIIERIENDSSLIAKITNADRQAKERLLGLIMDAAPAFYIDAHDMFLSELRKAGFSELEKLGASPTIELDASTGEKAFKQGSKLVQALTTGEGAIPIDELAKIILIEGKENLYTRQGFYVYRMARPNSMNTIPVKVYNQIADGKGAKDVVPMTLLEAKVALTEAEKEFGLNDAVFEQIAAKLLDNGVQSFITAEQNLRLGILTVAIQEALKSKDFNHVFRQISNVIHIWDTMPEEYQSAIAANRQALNSLLSGELLAAGKTMAINVITKAQELTGSIPSSKIDTRAPFATKNELEITSMRKGMVTRTRDVFGSIKSRLESDQADSLEIITLAAINLEKMAQIKELRNNTMALMYLQETALALQFPAMRLAKDKSVDSSVGKKLASNTTMDFLIWEAKDVLNKVMNGKKNARDFLQAIERIVESAREQKLSDDIVKQADKIITYLDKVGTAISKPEVIELKRYSSGYALVTSLVSGNILAWNPFDGSFVEWDRKGKFVKDVPEEEGKLAISNGASNSYNDVLVKTDRDGRFLVTISFVLKNLTILENLVSGGVVLDAEGIMVGMHEVMALNNGNIITKDSDDLYREWDNEGSYIGVVPEEHVAIERLALVGNLVGNPHNVTIREDPNDRLIVSRVSEDSGVVRGVLASNATAGREDAKKAPVIARPQTLLKLTNLNKQHKTGTVIPQRSLTNNRSKSDRNQALASNGGLSLLHEDFAELAELAKSDANPYKVTLYIREATGKVAVEEVVLSFDLFDKEDLLQYLAALINIRGMVNGAVEVGLVTSRDGIITKEEIREVLRRDFGKTESFVTFGKTINFVDGELKSVGAAAEKAGREARRINYNKGESLGFDVGGTNIKVALKSDGMVALSETIPLDKITTPLGDFIEYKIGKIEEKFGIQLSQKPTYITIPGPVTPAGEIVTITNLEDKRHGTQASLESLKRRLPNIRFQNDGNVATFYEMAEDPALQGKNVILNTLGTGTGLGIVVNGELLKGPMEAHIRIDFSQKAVFHKNFSMRGDLESYTNTDFVVRRTKELINQQRIAASEEINPEVVAGWLSKPDTEPFYLIARQVYAEFGENLAVLYKEISRVTGVDDWNVVNAGGIAQGEAIKVIIEGAKGVLSESPDIKVDFLIREDAPMRGALGAADLGLQEQQMLASNTTAGMVRDIEQSLQAYSLSLLDSAHTRRLEISQDGNRIFLLDSSGRVRILGLNGEFIGILIAGGFNVGEKYIGGLPNGSILTQDSDGEINIWHQDGELIATIEDEAIEEAAKIIACLPNGNILIQDSKWKISVFGQDGEYITALESEKVRIGEFHIEGLLDGSVLSKDSDGQVRIRTLDGYVASLETEKAIVGKHFIKALPNGNIVTSDSDGEARIWGPNADLITTIGTIGIGAGSEFIKAFSDSSMLTRDIDGQLRIWGPDGKFIAILGAVGIGVETGSVDILKNDDILVKDSDGRYEIWSKLDGKLIGVLEDKETEAKAMSVQGLSNGNVVIQYSDGQVKIWSKNETFATSRKPAMALASNGTATNLAELKTAVVIFVGDDVIAKPAEFASAISKLDGTNQVVVIARDDAQREVLDKDIKIRDDINKPYTVILEGDLGINMHNISLQNILDITALRVLRLIDPALEQKTLKALREAV